MKFKGTALTDVYKRAKSSIVRVKYGNPAKDVKVIAVVGTNGRVTTARFIEEMLQETGQTTVRLEMEHTRAHTPQEIQEFLRVAKKNNASYAVLTLKSKDITEHSLGALPLEAVVVTNVSDTKAESAEKQLKAISMLLDQAPKHTVFNRDDSSYEHLVEHISAAQDMTYGEHEDAEARIDKKTLYKRGGEVRLVIDHRTSIELATYLVGEANLYNLAAAVATMYVIGEKITMLDEGAARLEAIHGNYHYIESERPYTVAIDYAPNDSAVLKIADTAHQLTKRRLIVVVEAENLQQDTIDTISKKAARTIVVSNHEAAEKRGSLEHVNTVETAVDRVLKTARKDDTVLFAGSIFVDKFDDINGAITNTSEES